MFEQNAHSKSLHLNDLRRRPELFKKLREQPSGTSQLALLKMLDPTHRNTAERQCLNYRAEYWNNLGSFRVDAGV